MIPIQNPGQQWAFAGMTEVELLLTPESNRTRGH